MNSSALPAVVVGTGFGCRVQVPALRAAGFNVVGLVGNDAARTAERAKANGVPQSFTDLDAAISRTGAVAVAVAAPPHSHGAVTLAAIARGCHVLCEKPFAKDAAEARAMLSAAQRAKVAHVIGHEFRWLPERAVGARLIAEGAIGEATYVSFTQFIPYLQNTTDMPVWWFDAAAGGGWLGAAGSHQVDWVRSWVGEFESLSASLPTASPRVKGVEDSFVFRFRLMSGAQGIVQQCAAMGGAPFDQVRIAGTKGTLGIDGTDVWIDNGKGMQKVATPPDLVLPPMGEIRSDDPRLKSPKWQMLIPTELPGYTRLAEAWRDMIEGRAPPNRVRVPTFADGLACMEVLDAIRASAAKDGAVVRINRS